MPRAALAAGLLALAMAGAARAAWVPVAFPRADATLRAVATDGRRIAVSGSKGTFGISADGGRGWRLGAPGDGDALDFRGVALSGPAGVALMSAGDGAEGRARLYHSADGGLDWTLAYETRAPGAFFDTVAFRGPRGMVLGDPAGGEWGRWASRDGGRSWTPVRTPAPPLATGEAAFAASNTALVLGPGGRVWIASGGGARGRVFRSVGQSWFAVSDTPIPGSATGGVFGLLAVDGRRLVAVGGDHKDETRAGVDIAVSDDGGATWRTAASAGRLLEGVGRLDARTLIAVGPRGTLVSRDLGRTWNAVDTEAFHAIACARRLCVAAGPKGRVAVWRD